MARSPSLDSSRFFAESGGVWSQGGDAIAGVDANDRFGRSVSIADNGSRLAASSYIHDGSRGHLRLFDLTGDSWVQYGPGIEGENSADRFGNGILSVTLTGDGSRVASGSTLYGDAGRVRVFASAERSRRKLRRRNLLRHHLLPQLSLQHSDRLPLQHWERELRQSNQLLSRLSNQPKLLPKLHPPDQL
jgi:hypothetical protein